MHELLDSIFDRDSFLECRKEFAPSIITGFAELEGSTVGVVADNPCQIAGVLTCDSSVKAARFVRFCDSFRIPVISFTDVPGYLPGVAEEGKGIIRHGAKLIYAFSEATVLKINVIIRRAYGGAYIAMNSKALGADVVFAWPDTEISVLGAESAVRILYGRELEGLPEEERERFRQEKMQAYRENTMSEESYLKNRYVDRVILPEHTREVLAETLRKNGRKKSRRKASHGNIPL